MNNSKLSDKKSIDGMMFKTQPFIHQLDAVKKAIKKRGFAYTGEQGTGKSYSIIIEFCIMFNRHLIDQVVIVAPKGAEVSWIKTQLNQHCLMPFDAFVIVANNTKKYNKKWAHFLNKKDEGKLKVIAINWDYFKFEGGLSKVKTFMRGAKIGNYTVLDESHYMKTPTSARSKAAYQIAPLSKVKRIASGTPILNTPFDAFSQYNFIDHSILTCSNYTAFKSRHAEMLEPGNALYDHIMKNSASKRQKQIVATDSMGRPRYKKLDMLREQIEPYSFRILKKDCVDLPDKIYQSYYFDITKEQRKVYDALIDDLMLYLDPEKDPLGVEKIATIIKAMQATSGFFQETITGKIFPIGDKNPKLDLVIERIEDLAANGKQAIVWCNLKEEALLIKQALIDRKLTYCIYEGETSSIERAEYVKAFQGGEIQFFIANQQAGSTAITLTNASNVLYFSNRYQLGLRLQSEDRAHRIGLKHNVIYEDFIANDTIDEKIIKALQFKKELADTINGDDLK